VARSDWDSQCNAVDEHPFLREMHRDNGFNFKHVLRAVEGTYIKGSVVLKRNTDEIGNRILRRFPKFIHCVGTFAFVVGCR